MTRPKPKTLELLEVRTAELERALDLLDTLECALTANGSFMAPDDQLAVRDTRAMLVEYGKRAPPAGRMIWVDRDR